MQSRIPDKAVSIFCDFLNKHARAAALTVLRSAEKKKVNTPKGEAMLWSSMDASPDWPIPTRVPGVEWVTGTGNGPEFNYRRR